MTWTPNLAPMDDAVAVARDSDDPRTRVGCVIVDRNGTIVARAANRFAPGIDASDAARRQVPAKYLWIEHAERAALFHTARLGIPTAGAAIYVHGGFPCADCARAIISCGITKLVYSLATSNVAHWEENYQVSRAMLSEAKTVIFEIDTDGSAMRK